MIAQAKRPIVYAGGGVINAGPRACELLTRFVRLLGVPCTNTLMGLGAFPGSDPQFLGMLGMHGTYEANLAMYNCDVMIDRKSVVEGKSVSVRVDLGCRRVLKKKN